MSFELIITLDYELPAGGEGDVRRQMIAPTAALLDLCEAHRARLTIMAEMGELWAFEDLANAAYGRALGYEPAHLVRGQLAGAVMRGHDVQLHLHPQWIGGRWAGGHWSLDYTHYRLTDFGLDEAARLLRRGKEDLEALLRPHHPGYACVGFRAGHWSTHPSDLYLAALAKAGLRSDASVFKWGFAESAAARFDYRAAFSNIRPWHAEPGDINRPAPNGRGLLVVPIATELRWPLALLTPSRLRLAGEILRESRRIAASAAGQSRNEQPTRGGPGLFRKLTHRRPVKLDFCKLGAGQMLAMVERLMEQEEPDQTAQDGPPIPLMMIGHSKQAAPAKALGRFLDQAVGRFGERLRFSTYRQFVERYTAAEAAGPESGGRGDLFDD